MKLPPYAELLGLSVGDDGVFTMTYGDHLIGAPGRLHGGAVAGLMEMAANITVARAVDNPAAALKPVNVTVDYLREGGMEDSHARATIVRLGRRVANVRVDAWQSDPGRLIAAARMNILISRP